MKKEDIRILIVIVIICLFIVGLVLLLNKKNNSEKMVYVTEYNTFFSIINCINEYIDYIANNNKEGAYELLSTDYIKKNNIVLNNLYEKIEKYPHNTAAEIRKIETVKVGNSNIYYTNGKIIQNNYKETKIIKDSFSIIVLIDYDNMTYSVYPIENNNYERIINNLRNISIAKNNHNVLKNSGLINKEQICVLYMSDYVNKINNDFDKAYELLSKKMKKRYQSVELYRNYINNEKNKITTVADKCSVDEGDNNTRTYYVIDSNENEYTFYEDGIMNYTVDISFSNNIEE